MYALISTLAATEAPNGIDMFSGAATKLIYICPVSSSCSPHVTSCHVGALIAESPWPCRLLLLFLAFLPLTRSVVSLLPALSMTPNLHVSSIFPLINDDNVILFLGREKSASIYPLKCYSCTLLWTLQLTMMPFGCLPIASCLRIE